jgi:cell division protein FtsI/penicillin-binding protein 2
MSAMTIANNGKLMQPTLVKEITDSNGKAIPVWRDTPGNLFVEVTGSDGKTAWRAENGDLLKTLPSGAWQISPFQGGHMKWDITVDKKIENFQCEATYCTDLNTTKTVQLSAIKSVQQGMRLAVADPQGTLHDKFPNWQIAVAGKTGTAEYCDDVARLNNRCQFGQWPAHAWTLAYAPYDDPEIAVVAFAYNGNEGSTVAAPIVEKVLKAYFCLKSVDSNPNPSNGCE